MGALCGSARNVSAGVLCVTDAFARKAGPMERLLKEFDECLLFLQVYDTATGHRILTFNDPNSSNNYSKNLATFNPTDDLVLNDGVLWDVRGNRVIRKFDKFNDVVSGVFHPSGLEIIINSEIVSLYLARNLFDTMYLLTEWEGRTGKYLA